jgi:ATP-dependent DNA ligase
MPPVSPMLAKPATSLPLDMHYEGKWDGFRAVIFRDGDDVVIGSRNEKPLTRYFPEVVELALAHLPTRCVVDGEIIIDTDGHLDFDALLNRIHPAPSRVAMLADATPASYVAFDVLAFGDEDLTGREFVERRSLLTDLGIDSARLHVAPGTRDPERALQWFIEFEGVGLDGVMAKPLSCRYEFGKRTMFKLKHQRTADCVVAGYRWHKSGTVVGSLLLGLYDDDGLLHQVGVCASFTAAKRAELVEILAPYVIAAGEEHPWLAQSTGQQGQRMPGGQTRWNAGKDLGWIPLRQELVVEVGYDHMQSGRFRHTAKFVRWRSDRDAQSCNYSQLEVPTGKPLSEVFSA